LAGCHTHGRNHGFVVQRLAQLDILLKKGCDALHAGFQRLIGFGCVARDPHGGLHKAFGVGDLQDLAALNAFN